MRAQPGAEPSFPPPGGLLARRSHTARKDAPRRFLGACSEKSLTMKGSLSPNLTRRQVRPQATSEGMMLSGARCARFHTRTQASAEALAMRPSRGAKARSSISLVWKRKVWTGAALVPSAATSSSAIGPSAAPTSSMFPP